MFRNMEQVTALDNTDKTVESEDIILPSILELKTFFLYRSFEGFL